MNFYDRQILDGLSKVPSPQVPGIIIVTGNAQAVLTGEKAGDVIIAAAEIGNGRIIATAHDCYLNWINDKSDPLKKDFMLNVKKWLANTDSDVSDSEIIDLNKLKETSDLSAYKIIKWHHNDKVDEQFQSKIYSYVENGGSLFCGSTPWGYLQVNPNKTLKDMCLYNFLKNFAGILYTPKFIWMPNEVDVSKNKAKISQFDLALKKITSNPKKITKYCNTIQNALEFLSQEGIITENKISDIKSIILEECDSCNMNVIPTNQSPICDLDSKNAVKLIGKCLIFSNGEKAPGIENFPGDFNTCPRLLDGVQLTLSSKFNERISTGYYLPAGVHLLVNVESGQIKGWNVRIGAHTDDLSDTDKLKRWPCVSIVKNLTEQLNISSPFGGLIYFESPKEGEIFVTLTNVVEAPYIDLTIPETVANWSRRQHSLGLWAELAGKHIIFTAPSEYVRHIENPVEVLEFWDEVVKTHHELRGTNVSNFKRERVVMDEQPSCGYMHSGYPIVTHLDCGQDSYDECVFDINKLKEKGCWGLFHELGHNMQRNEWTFDGSTEVTVNIFSMHAMQFLVGKEITKQKWLLGHIQNQKKYFSKLNLSYDDWKHSCEIALLTFAMLIKHFGWEPMYKFMKEYEEDILSHKPNLPKNNQEKIDQWVLRFSKIVSRNIKPHFEMFGLPVSASVNEKLTEYQPWCPTEDKDPNVFFNL